MASLTLSGEEEFVAALRRAREALRERAEGKGILEHLERIEREYVEGPLPPKDLRPWAITKIVVERVPWESDLALLLCEVEYFYCRMLRWSVA